MKATKLATSVRVEATPVRSKSRKRRPFRRVGDWAETVPSREHIPLQERMAQSIATSSFLSKLPVLGREQPEDVLRMIPEELIPVLQQAEVDAVLAGAHGLAGWLSEPRATQDVDFIIRIRDRKRAADAILKKYPNLILEKHLDVWRFKSATQYVVDLALARAPLFKRVIGEFEVIQFKTWKVKVPKLEAALAMKFASMVGHYRPMEKKYLDAGDFVGVIQANSKINLDLLLELGELAFLGGGAEIVKYVADVRAGRRLGNLIGTK